MARHYGKRASELAGIDDEIAALDFDLACFYRFQIYDNLRERDMARTIGIACAMALSGKVLEFPDEKTAAGDDGECTTI